MKEFKNIDSVFLRAEWIFSYKFFKRKQYKVLCIIKDKNISDPILLSSIKPSQVLYAKNFVEEYKLFRSRFWKENYPLNKKTFKNFKKSTDLTKSVKKRNESILKDFLKFESKMTEEEKLFLELF